MKPEITNYNTYLARMDVSLPDKAFFVYRAPLARVIVDFGCAAGNLFRYIRSISNQEYIMIGYDNDATMRELASEAADVVCGTLAELREAIERTLEAHNLTMKNVLFNFSSVLHEMNNYEIDDIFSFINKLRPGYISIRDMKFRCKREFPSERFYISDEKYLKQFHSFLAHRGIFLPDLADFAEYLLKYKYTENWERELEEHYFFGFTRAETYYCELINNNKYRPTWDVNYCLPHFDRQIKDDFNIFFNVSDYFTTHEQLLLERTDL